MDLEEAKKMVEQEKKERLESCQKELQALLEKHNCEIIAVGQFQGNNLQTNITLISK